MSITSIPCFNRLQRTGEWITLQSDEGHVAHIWVLEEDMVRVMVLPFGVLRFPRTWAIAPGLEDVPYEGCDRLAPAGFNRPAYQFAESTEELLITTSRIRLKVRRKGFYLEWAVRRHERWQPAAEDRATQSYNFGWWDARIYHYLRREPGEMYFGLGERAGNLDRAGQSYRLTNLDAMGYNARTTDPLYKHIPFYLTVRRQAEVSFGLLYDTVSDCTFDFGRELDNYHGHYRYFVADHGDLDYYFIEGSDLAKIVRRYTWLTGRPIFTPRWGLGYSGSTMAYTEAPDAQERLQEFLQRCEEHDILCDSFHLSSGYTSIGDKRYVFHWNRAKFPDPAGFAQSYLERGVRLCANIKPCLLRDHPLFEEAHAQGLLVRNADGTPAMVQFWDEAGAYLDFSNPATCAWWKSHVKEALLAYGVTSTWNDNNEFEVWSDGAWMHGFGQSRRACEAKPLQTLLMMRASWEAQREFTANLRPYLITRAGTVGLHRYVQTWSGDNYTSWETLRYNNKMGLGLALSGVSNLGHDVGGFSGPPPDPELLLRWVQFGIFLPRFSIHSWNDDHSVNEPWMYPEITPQIRDLIKLRYRFIPYLYHLLWRSHTAYEPIIRPMFYDFPEDARCFEENDDFLLGGDLLVAAVLEPGQSMRLVYLPAGSGWYDFWTGEFFLGGQEIRLPAPWDRPPLLARAGSAIPLNVAEQRFSGRALERAFAVFPPRDHGEFRAECFEDDGESESYRAGNYRLWRLVGKTTATEIILELSLSEEGLAGDEGWCLLLPPQETRSVRVPGRPILRDQVGALHREVRVGVRDS